MVPLDLPVLSMGGRGVLDRKKIVRKKKSRTTLSNIHYSRNEYRNEYLFSDEWKDIRERFLKNAGYKCERTSCMSSKQLDVHHINYHVLKRPGKETCNDLIVLCRKCHNFIEYAKKIKAIPINHTRETVLLLNKSIIDIWLFYEIRKQFTLKLINGKIKYIYNGFIVNYKDYKKKLNSFESYKENHKDKLNFLRSNYDGPRKATKKI